MQGSSANAPVWAQIIPFVIVAIVVVVRMARPQRISVTRMWLTPIILCLIAGYAIWATETINPAPVWEIAAALGIGAGIGVPFGLLRGYHTNVRPTEKPGVMYLDASWITGLIYVGAFGLRFAIRTLMPHKGETATAVGDGLLAFAIAYIGTSYFAIYRKYELEVAGKLKVDSAQ